MREESELTLKAIKDDHVAGLAAGWGRKRLDGTVRTCTHDHALRLDATHSWGVKRENGWASLREGAERQGSSEMEEERKAKDNER